MFQGQLKENLGQISEAEGAIDADTRSLAMAQELEALDDMPQLLAQRAQHRLFLGDIEGAGRDAEEAVVSGERIGHPEGVLFSHVSMAMVERRRGDLAAARDRLIYDAPRARHRSHGRNRP